MEIICRMLDVKSIQLSGTKKREYLKEKINELVTNSKNKNMSSKYLKLVVSRLKLLLKS
jgi:hypothetical protein